MCAASVAGVEGVEPSHTVPETAVLPLDDTPSATDVHLPCCQQDASASEYIKDFQGISQELKATFFNIPTFTQPEIPHADSMHKATLGFAKILHRKSTVSGYRQPYRKTVSRCSFHHH